MAEPRTLTIPALSLVALLGASGSGKSTFAQRHFCPTEVLSSDVCRGLVSDDENDQTASADAFEVLHFIARKRLAAGRLTVVDATNVQRDARQSLVALAREHYCIPVAIALDLPEGLCYARNQARPDRAFGPHVVHRQAQDLRRSLPGLEREGFRYVYVLRSPEEVEAAQVVRQPLAPDRRQERGPFDLIGDVHGCADELEELLGRLGYVAGDRLPGEGLASGPVYTHPAGRKAVFLGDVVDRGPRVLDCLRLVACMVRAGSALCVPGNHEDKLAHKLRGRNVQVTHGLERTVAEMAALPEAVRQQISREICKFVEGLTHHYVLDEGRLVVAHAGMKAAMQGRSGARVRSFALYGETTGESHEYGLPVRYNWVAEYRGKAMVAYGHTPVPEPKWLNNTICLDTGCTFGGRLTALRYPERELVSVPARRAYYVPARPLQAPPASALTAQQREDTLLDLEDMAGR